MDINAYISSGIIETYVLGMATVEESAELLSYADQYPEIKQAILEEELVMENVAMQDAVVAPAYLKNKLQHSLLGTTNNEAENKPSETIVRNINITKGGRSGFWKYLAVAASLLFIISIAFMMVTSDRIKEDNKLAMEKLEQQKIAQQKEMEDMKAEMALVTDPAIKKIPLMGIETHPDNNATLYWDTRNTDVYLKMHDMPAPQQDKQYQLWAIVDGKPVDLGVFENGNNDSLMQKMKSIPKAEMFAITLEVKGGSPTPTMDEMYVAAKI